MSEAAAPAAGVPMPEDDVFAAVERLHAEIDQVRALLTIAGYSINDTVVTFFGAGAAFYASCLKAGVEPQAAGDLGSLRAIGAIAA